MVNKLLLWLSFTVMMWCRFLELRVIIVTEFLLIEFIEVHRWGHRLSKLTTAACISSCLLELRLEFVASQGRRCTILRLVWRSVLNHCLHGHFRSLVSRMVDVKLLS